MKKSLIMYVRGESNEHEFICICFSQGPPRIRPLPTLMAIEGRNLTIKCYASGRLTVAARNQRYMYHT